MSLGQKHLVFLTNCLANGNQVTTQET